jgi:hypothetical protein
MKGWRQGSARRSLDRVPLVLIEVDPEVIPALLQGWTQEQPEEPPMDEQDVLHVPLLSEAEIAPRRLVELINVAQPYEIRASRPGVQRLQTLVLMRRHEGHGLEHVASDEIVAPPSPRMGHGALDHRDLVGDDEEIVLRMIRSILRTETHILRKYLD